jgi:hypothetical protein
VPTSTASSAKAINSHDVDMIKTLTPIIQYVSPKPKEVGTHPQASDALDALSLEEARKLAALAR